MPWDDMCAEPSTDFLSRASKPATQAISYGRRQSKATIVVFEAFAFEAFLKRCYGHTKVYKMGAY